MMGCANNNRIKWQITVAVSDWVLFPNIAFPPQIQYYKSRKYIKTPGTNKAKWSLQTARILVTGCANSSWQLTVAVSSWIHFFKILHLHNKHCTVNFVNIPNIPYTQQTRHSELEMLSVGCANSILAASYSHQQYITKQRNDFFAGLTFLAIFPVKTLKGLAFHTHFDYALIMHG